MNATFVWRVFLLSLVTVLWSCQSAPVRNFSLHALTIDGDGDIESPSVDGAGFSKLGPAENGGVAKYVDTLFNAADQQPGAKHLLIFVHGGLNSLSKSTKRANRLIEKYDNGELGRYYPILINWDSGLWESYFEHLLLVRQGESKPEIGLISSPFFFAADLGRGVVRSPSDITNTTYRDIQAIPGLEANQFTRNSDILYKEIAKNYPYSVTLGRKSDKGVQSVPKVLWNILTGPVQIVFTPIIDAFGTPAWEAMQRRAKVLYNKPAEFDINEKKDNAVLAIKREPKAVMSVFAERLSEYSKKWPNSEVTIIAHSMGTFIINQMLRKYPDIPIKDIVYMAGADSIRNTFDSVFWYMEKHEHTRFYNLTLHPKSDLEETNYGGLAPRGSLLVWITDFFSAPHTQFDRTIGRWEDVIQAYGEVPNDLRNRVFIKAFDQTSAITAHGDFTCANFWDEAFWKPGGQNNGNPWPKAEGESGFYCQPK